MQDIPIPELLQLLSEGQTFAVHRARLGSSGPTVIVKMPSRRADRAQAVARLEIEFAITRGIELSGALFASHWLDTKRGPMLVFADEGLKALDTSSGMPMAPDVLIALARQVAGTLGALHEAGIIHRDVNPSNLIASSDLTKVRLIDFCTAIRADELARERPSSFAAKGTLGYMAPEQSGRMDRQVDLRADLYSLGVTLYQLATGRQPFENTDAATVIHRHLTELPPAPRDLNPAIPKFLSDAIIRLIEKNPEDRFQSAADFVGAISNERDSRKSASLSIPDKLYGRKEMLAELAGTITNSVSGRSRLIRVAGPSGTGKSALIANLVRPAVESGTNFVQGKFDQLDRARPYGAFLQSFDMLLRRLLAGSSEEVAIWRARLLDALSPNAQVLLDIMPRYRALIGPQPQVPALGLNEAQIRMSLVFRRFVGALAQADAPLVIFLDDLQWSDSASRALIELLLIDPEIRHLTILTAYRDNEVGPGHPAMLMFSTLNDRVGLEPVIEVGPLAPAHVAELVGDALGETAETAEPLARIITEKTAGNPFFIRQFIFALVRKGLVFHDAATGRWSWDRDRPAAEQFTSNVADLVVERILALPEDTQQIVQFAACNGNNFETSVLALAAERSSQEIERLLEPAVQSAVVLPAEDDEHGRHIRYRFQHDRVQQVAHDILPADRRSLLHARIGAILLEKTPEGSGRLIEITDHLIAGRQHLNDAMRTRLRDLSLDAARQTKAANAYDAALRYLDAAEETLGSNAWDRAPRLTFQIALERAEAAYLQNRTEMAEEIAGSLLVRDLEKLDQVRVLELMILLYTSQLNYRKALDVGKQALTLLGEKLPLSPGVPRVISELIFTKLRVARLSDQALLELPRMRDAHKLAAMRVLVLLAPPAYFSAPNLLPVIALRMVRLSVRYGNAPHSAYGYVIYGMLHCAVLGETQRGLAYGQLARRAAIELGAQDIEGRVLMVFAGFIQHWTAPLAETLPVFLEGADKSISVGDLEYHGYTRYAHASYALMGGQSLVRVSDYLDHHLAAVTDSRHEKTKRIITMARASVGRMRGLTDDAYAGAFDEVENFQLWTEQADATSLAYFHKYKLLEALMSGDYGAVLFRARCMTANLNGILSMAFQPFYQFYEALALVELSRAAPAVQRQKMRFRARLLTRRLERWARHAPGNFAHRAELLRAELASATGRWDAAMKGFDSAIANSRQVGALHDVGLFLERAARFYRERGAHDLAAFHLAAALTAHTIWGAEGWSSALAERYPQLFQNLSAYKSNSTTGDTSGLGSVDTETLIRAAAALAQKTSLAEVVAEVMRAIVVNAGAARGALMLDDGSELRLAAEMASNGQVNMVKDRLAADCENIPHGIVNYVRHAAERVVLNDAPLDATFGTDAYITAAHPCSVLCVPLVSQGTIIGIVYLENARVRGAFTPDRCHTVEILGAQAAVSLENARLFDELRGALERQVELTSAHARFVPHAFLEMLGRPSIADVRLGDHVRGEASILFSDIRGFTALLESLGPDQAIEFINAYLSRMEPAVQASGGFVDSYIGDAVMAVFQHGPEAAIDAGIAMTLSLRDWSAMNAREGHTPIRIGIGIATGELIFGTIGAANRLTCGVIGDTVNLASRVEGLTKHYGTGILITYETYRALPDPTRYQIREIDLVTVVGRKTPVRLFEVFDADPASLRVQKSMTAPAIAHGLALYRSGDIKQALKIFKECCDLAPEDPLAPRLMQRCKRERDLIHSSDWDGIERMTKK